MTTTTAMSTTTRKLDGAARPYLTFQLGDEEYAVEILAVQEIRGYAATTRLPNAPPHVKGVMNLRGTVVPVVDLRARFGMPSIASTKFTVIIIVALAGRIVGMLVDAVSDVLELALAQAPDLGTSVDTSLIAGVSRDGERLILVLALERVLGLDDDPRLGASSATSAALPRTP